MGDRLRWMRAVRLTESKSPGEFVQALGSPGRGAGPAIAGSEGSGFSLEKPPPEAECRPGYLESPVFAPPAQGLAKGQAGTPQSAALPAPLPGDPLSVRIRPSLLIPLLCTAPHQSRLRRASITFYGIAATGSYDDLNSLRDAPPGGEAL